MGPLQREWEIKLDLLAALARSQSALAKLLESAASTGEASAGAAELLRDNVRLLAELQRTMTGAAFGLKLRRPAEGRSGPLLGPWLNRLVRPETAASGSGPQRSAARTMAEPCGTT